MIENSTVRYTLQGGFHLLLHALLTWLARWAFRRFAWGRANRWPWVGFGLLSAVLSEAAQHWIPGRVADGWDLLWNLVGVGIVGALERPGKR